MTFPQFTRVRAGAGAHAPKFAVVALASAVGVAFLAFSTTPALAADTIFGSSSPLLRFVDWVTGPLAYSIVILALVISVGTFALGGEFSGFARRMPIVVVAGAMVILADTVVTNLFRGSRGAEVELSAEVLAACADWRGPGPCPAVFGDGLGTGKSQAIPDTAVETGTGPGIRMAAAELAPDNSSSTSSSTSASTPPNAPTTATAEALPSALPGTLPDAIPDAAWSRSLEASPEIGIVDIVAVSIAAAILLLVPIAVARRFGTARRHRRDRGDRGARRGIGLRNSDNTGTGPSQ